MNCWKCCKTIASIFQQNDTTLDYDTVIEELVKRFLVFVLFHINIPQKIVAVSGVK